MLVLFILLMCKTTAGLIVNTSTSVNVKNNINPCQPDKLVAYKVIMHTFWTRDQFPKHYPEWRPTAQWSRLLGRSHGPEYVMFRFGSRVSESVKAFAEGAHGNGLDEMTGQGTDDLLDDFSAPAIATGAGRTEAIFHADSNHSLVSLMSKMVPSPDWFVGLDSFQLCMDGGWLDSITIEADPLDAGTDNGFTFTAPNWPTDPQGIVYRMTSHYPSHPAGSFYYPHLKRLPPIATFQFIKLQEYELTERFNHGEDENRYELLLMEHIDSNAISVMNNNNNNNNNNDDIAREIEEERQEEPLLMTVADIISITTPIPSDVLPRGDKDAILNSILESYTSPKRQKIQQQQQQHQQQIIKLRNNIQRKNRPPRDCRVSEWSSWSSCSKSCGIGEMQRHRQVKKHPRRGGHPCPSLIETKWCGSARACKNAYFHW